MTKVKTDRESNRALRRRFCNNIFRASPVCPEEDLALLCNEWLKVMRADWVWLWLADRSAYSTEFQLVATAGGDGKLELPRVLARESNNSVAAYCITTKEPCWVNDMRNWGKEIGGLAYQVGLVDVLERNGCTSFCSVPIDVARNTESASSAASSTISAVACIHYNDARPVAHENDSLHLLAGISGQWIANSQGAHQKEVLLALNDIAYRHVARHDQSAEERRGSYANEVVAVVCRELRVSAATIFWEDNYREELRCIATTGLLFGDDHSDVEDISLVRYRPMVGLTGRCWHTSESLVSTHHHSSTSNARFVEKVTSHDGKTLREPATIIHPIPKFSRPGDIMGPSASGVIRCASHCSSFFGAQKLKFNSVEIQTLDFICKQIAPVLANVSATIAKERAIHRAAHDINAAVRLLDAHLENTHINEEQVRPKSFAVAIEKALVGAKMSGLLLNSASSELTMNLQVRVFSKCMVLNELLKHCVPALRYWVESQGCKLSYIERGLCQPVCISEGLLERALINLVENAFKYGEAKGEIIIAIEPTGAGTIIDVANYGVGIDPDEEDRIFETGFRSERGRKTRGDGLGLPSARRLIRQMGGTLLVARPANPTVFRIMLPTKQA